MKLISKMIFPLNYYPHRTLIKNTQSADSNSHGRFVFIICTSKLWCKIIPRYANKAVPINTGERQDGAAAELRVYRCGNVPAAEIQRVYRW